MQARFEWAKAQVEAAPVKRDKFEEAKLEELKLQAAEQRQRDKEQAKFAFAERGADNDIALAAAVAAAARIRAEEEEEANRSMEPPTKEAPEKEVSSHSGELPVLLSRYGTLSIFLLAFAFVAFTVQSGSSMANEAAPVAVEPLPLPPPPPPPPSSQQRQVALAAPRRSDDSRSADSLDNHAEATADAPADSGYCDGDSAVVPSSGKPRRWRWRRWMRFACTIS